MKKVVEENSVVPIVQNSVVPIVQVNSAAVRDVTAWGGGSYVMHEDAQANWIARVALTPKQAVVAFLKFGTVGIGFEVEDADWNTNLPCTISARDIFEHIRCNRGRSVSRAKVSDEAIIAAIEALRKFGAQYLGIEYDPVGKERVRGRFVRVVRVRT